MNKMLLLAEIHSKEEVLSQLVGDLYRNMIVDEISKLNYQLNSLTGKYYIQYTEEEIHAAVAERVLLLEDK